MVERRRGWEGDEEKDDWEWRRREEGRMGRLEEKGMIDQKNRKSIV